MSKCIMLIRHAEKPTLDVAGADDPGEPDPRSLSIRGWRRAAALAEYLGSALHQGTGEPLRRPRQIFSARPTPQHPSTRPSDTVRPLADLLDLPVNDRWSDQDSLQEFAIMLRALDDPVLVCWRHDDLPRLAGAILPGVPAPSVWPAHRFDVTWSIFIRRGEWVFAQTPQLLLAGDLAQGIDPIDG
jgi:hypothetical protein